MTQRDDGLPDDGTSDAVVELVVATPHAIHLRRDGETIELAPSGLVPRFVDSDPEAEVLQTVHGPCSILRFDPDAGRVVGLPAPRPGVIYVVSRLVAERATDRDDFVFPANFVRNDAGEILGCEGFGRIDHGQRG